MKLNRSPETLRTHEGGTAKHITPIAQLRRSVLSCLLWENEFYEDGQSIADRINEAADKVPVEKVLELAVEARTQYSLRHAPLLLLLNGVSRGAGRKAIADTISRPDELAELLATYWRNGKKPLSAQLKRGLADAFLKFDAYQFGKYNRDSAIKLRDVMFLCHPKPRTPEMAELFKQIATDTIPVPDTWEVALTRGADKKETFERLLREKKLGYLALLRNLRNMDQAGVDSQLIQQAIFELRGAYNVLPFRFVAAARAVPRFEPALDMALCAQISEMAPLPGKTVVLVDVSGSMRSHLSTKSDLTRMDAAAALGAIVTGDIRLFTFSNDLVECPPLKGMAGIDIIRRSQYHSGTYLGKALRSIIDTVPHDRIIVITDEQSHDIVPDPVATHAYMINVASARNGVGYGRWTHIDGFSERVLTFIHNHEMDMGV